jgi:hypothetical protein
MSAKLKAFYMRHKLPTTAKQVAAWEKENPPETWGELPESLRDPMAILARGEVDIRLPRSLSLSVKMEEG